MQLEGVVTNVAAFGAFVDVGVHQDGLVHISELSDRFVKDPREVVKAGDVVKVRVKEVDVGAQAHRADDEVGRHRSVGRRRIAFRRRRLRRNARAHRRRARPRSRRPKARSPPPCAAPRNASKARPVSAASLHFTSPMGRGRRACEA